MEACIFICNSAMLNGLDEFAVMFHGLIKIIIEHRQLGGLVVKMLACFAGGPVFVPW